jgi:hypothetical protein
MRSPTAATRRRGRRDSTGQAGWFMYHRVGAEPTTTTAFVVSTNPGA